MVHFGIINDITYLRKQPRNVSRGNLPIVHSFSMRNVLINTISIGLTDLVVCTIQ